MTQSAAAGDTAASQLEANYGKLPIGFEANQGQTDARVRFLARGKGYALFLTANEAVLSAPKSVLRMRLMGANTATTVMGAGELSGKSNYLIGKDPAKWHTQVPNFTKVKYLNIYRGIDLVYYGNRAGQFEYDFIVAPGADPGAIQLNVAADGSGPASKHRPPLRIAANGDLLVMMADGEIRFHKPVVYQEGERRVPRAGRFVLAQSNRVSFALGAYDHSKALIIDPVLSYSTYLGGSSIGGLTIGYAIAIDGSSNAYIAGSTTTSNFPTQNPYQPTFGAGGDTFITKLAPSGNTLVYSTYLDGSNGAYANGIAVDSSGAAYVVGQTGSSDFPTVNPIQATLAGTLNAFIAKLDPSGESLVYSTFYGGGNGANGVAIAVDGNLNAYVTGFSGTGLPTVNAFQPTSPGGLDTAFVAKVNPAGSAFVYATYLGGSAGSDATAIAADSAGNAYVTGTTTSKDFPLQAAFQSVNHTGQGTAFLSKFNPSGSALVYSTYLGGSTAEVAYAIAVDSSGDAYIAGQTGSSDFPTYKALQPSSAAIASSGVTGFITEFNPAGSALVYSTYLGGNVSDSIRAIGLDGAGNTYVAGLTSSNLYPSVNPLPVSQGGQSSNSYVSEISIGGSALIYSTQFGNNSIGQTTTTGQTSIEAMAVDAAGNVYLTGGVNSENYPTLNAFQATLQGESDAFVAKISQGAATTPTPTVTISVNPTTVTEGQSTTLTWSSTNATSCTASGAWTGAQSVSGSVAETPAAAGSSTYTLMCTGSGGNVSATATLTVNALPQPTVTISVNPSSITAAQTATLTWSSTNATSCTASGAWSGTQATSGSLQITPAATGSAVYSLNCAGASAGVNATSSAMLQVLAPSVTVTALSGKAGGGGLGLDLVLALLALTLLRVRSALRPTLAAAAMLVAGSQAIAQQSSAPLQFNWDASYVGIRAGLGDYTETSERLDAALVSAGETGTSTSITSHRASGVVYAGVPFYRSLSLELGFADLGTYPVSISTTSTNIPQLAQTIVHALPPAGRGLTLNLALPLNITSWFAIEPRFGLLVYQSKQEVFTPGATISDDRNGAGFDAGLALLIVPATHFSFGAGVDCFDAGGRCNVLLYSAVIEYHFGR